MQINEAKFSDEDLAALAAIPASLAARLTRAEAGRELERRRADRAEGLLRYCVGDAYFTKMQQQSGKTGGRWDEVEVICAVVAKNRGWLLDPNGPLGPWLRLMTGKPGAQVSP